MKTQNAALGYKLGGKEARASQIVIVIVGLGVIGIAISQILQGNFDA